MLRAEAIHKRYAAGSREVTPLSGASLSLRPGERLGLFGRSGSGKSTLARILALVQPADRGTVSVDGQAVSGWGVRVPRALRRQVQLIWQSPRLSCDPRLRLRDIILEPLRAQGELPAGWWVGGGETSDRRAGQRAGREAQEEVLRSWSGRAGLSPELLGRYPREVSDGQLQRACLARALSLRPGYLVCDEVSSMLDVSTQVALLDVLAAEQARRPLGILLITHDRALAHHWCQETVELHDLQEQ
jgi:ABC-type dipeptide/oligopeptide/nickel transport system ATPase subunit